MEISQLELTAPGRVVDAITDETLAQTTVAVYGKAKHLARLKAAANLRHLWVSGVNPVAIEVIGSLASLERLVIHDFRIADLQALASLKNLGALTVVGSPKLRSIAGIEGLVDLRSLVLFDNCNYPDVQPLAGLTRLETLCLEGGFSKRLSLQTLEPLGNLVALRRLRLAAIRVVDRSLRPLHDLRSLREVFIAKAFPPAEFRALGSALPDARGEFVDSFRNAG